MPATVGFAGATNGARPVVIVEQRIVARTCACEFPVFLDQDFDSNSRKTKGQKPEGEVEGFIGHAPKVEPSRQGRVASVLDRGKTTGLQF